MAVGRARTAMAAGMALYLVAEQADPFVTVPQRDDDRPVVGPATADISGDGRFVAFESLARLVADDTDARHDIYVLNRATSQVTLESPMAESWANASHPRLSLDGRYLVFEVDTLRDNGKEVHSNIVVCDRSSGVHTMLTAADGSAPNASSYSPEISDDGRVVTFSSIATNLVPGEDVNGPYEDVYVLDVQSRAVRRVSVDSTGSQFPGGPSFSSTVSADGRFIAFVSTAPLTPAAARIGGRASRLSVRQVYVRDQALGTTTLVSAAGDGWPDGPSMTPAISGDGRYVAFVSLASNLVRGDRNRQSDVFRHDRQTGATILVSRAADGGPANGRSMAPSVSFDGRFIAFQSDASNLVCARRCPSRREDLNLLWDVFVAEPAAGVVHPASEDHLGGWMEPSVGPAIDGAGHIVAFSSRHPVDDSDAANDFDLFVRTVADPQFTADRPVRHR